MSPFLASHRVMALGHAHHRSQAPTSAAASSGRQLWLRPRWLARLERAFGRAIPLHPNALSLAKLLLVAPLLLLALPDGGLLAASAWLPVVLFALFAALDYLDGVVARERGLSSRLGRVLDRATDWPLLLALSYLCVERVPVALVVVKLGIDVALVVAFAFGKGSTMNRPRTALSYAALLGLLALSQGWLSGLFTALGVSLLLLANVAVGAAVLVYNLELVSKRRLADLLSATNLACGVLAMVAASRGRFELGLLLLLLGAACDGLDGAAARRWGSSRWGVYSDDVADAVSYALAPAAALYCALGGVAGWALALTFVTLTLGRLVFFTLAKSTADPCYFCGAPSTVGALVAVCSIILWRDAPALLGLLVGVATMQMVSFDVLYRHLGRAVARVRPPAYAVPLVVLLVLAAGGLAGVRGPVVLVLLAALGYGMWPVLDAWRGMLQRRGGAVVGCRPCAAAR